MRRASLLVLVLLGGCAPGGEPAAAPGSESSYDWRRDDRLAYLDARCPGKGRFDEDTSDLLPVLVLKLQSAQRDVLRNVREELALGGVPALEELDRLVRRVATDPHGSPVLLNALAVARNSEATTSEVGRSLVRFCLGHPQETVRTAAVRVLKVHSVPEAYDDLMALLAVAAPAARQDFVPALVRSDPRRFEEQLAGWIEAGEEQDLWQIGAQLVAAAADGQTARRLAPLVAQVDAPAVRAYLAATADHTRDPGSLALLEAMLGEEDPTLRGHALSALEFTTATELIASAIDDESAGLRVQAAGLLSRRLEEEVALEALRRALFDPEEKVREVALGALLEVADPAAVDTVVAGWGGDLLELGIASRAVLDRWDRVEGLADRAADLLMDRLAERAGEPLARREALIQALAQVPGPRSTTWLLEHARSEEGTVAGFDAHRYLSLQASNTGPVGLEMLRQAWGEESDPRRRLDLLWAATTQHDEVTRGFMLEAVQAPDTLPHERLWLAERLAREGPAEEIAPLLKRVNLRVTDREVRPALECLLWRWYG